MSTTLIERLTAITRRKIKRSNSMDLFRTKPLEKILAEAEDTGLDESPFS